jgi:VIT1/CCC1 family predicted Fe2+/Mn2+ transporter
MKKTTTEQSKNFSKDRRGEFLSDIILGGQDGLVNTLGVILGIAAASAELRIIVAGGFAGAVAEAISMGAVGYTSKVAEKDFYISQLNREKREIKEVPQLEKDEIRDIYRAKGFEGELLDSVVKVITSNEKIWLETMMQEELKLAPVEERRPLVAAFWVGISAFVGALVPLTPFVVFYILALPFEQYKLTGIITALVCSALVLFWVGIYKSKLTAAKWYKGGLQIMIIGMVSALVGYLIGSVFSL